ncbi:hypothetical protein [Streptomyces europaeiscabiei]|uniref:hypothetical protein n=1 Tax=Streptomyces europaeiscabiei TaxID=146819 RepID=UPI002E10E77B|nr:hypothetical protein OHB30_02145 [Streptomyces europaeiscabiei]
MARWLADNGVSAVRALPHEQPIEAAGRPVTFWVELPPHEIGTVMDAPACRGATYRTILRPGHRLRRGHRLRAGLPDDQDVRLCAPPGQGADARKRIVGHKRYLGCDTLGPLLTAACLFDTTANTHLLTTIAAAREYTTNGVG